MTLNFNTLWIECEALYPANKDVCLSLQDEYGINVNLLLLALYLDKNTDIRYNLAQWQQLAASIENWETKILKPYRQLRCIAKDMLAQSEYQQMLDVELMMERKSQRFINQQLKDMKSFSDSPNVDIYLGMFHSSLQNKIQLTSGSNNL